MDLLGHRVCMCSALAHIINCFPKYFTYLPFYQNCIRDSVTPYSCSGLIFVSFILVIVLNLGILQNGFNFHFPMINFCMTIGYLDTLFYQAPVQVLSISTLGWYFKVSVRNSLYVLPMNPLLNICFAMIFFPSYIDIDIDTYICIFLYLYTYIYTCICAHTHIVFWKNILKWSGTCLGMYTKIHWWINGIHLQWLKWEMSMTSFDLALTASKFRKNSGISEKTEGA